MGCDIHLHIEVKAFGKWYHYNQPNIKRNYELFGWLGCDRGDEIMFPEKGIPEDITGSTRLCYAHAKEKYTAHHVSYLTWREIDKLMLRLEKESPQNAFDITSQFGYLFGNSFDLRWPKDNPKFLGDVRFIYWFDN